MTLRILSANLAGGNRKAKLENLVDGYSNLIEACAPQVLLFQEAAREIPQCEWAGALMRNLGSEMIGDRRDFLGQLAAKHKQYQFFFAPTIQSNRDSHPDKWKRTRVAPDKIRAQGCALGVRKEQVTILDFWTGKPNPFAEPIELTLPAAEAENAPLYGGIRDSEPRIAQGLRLLCDGRDWVVWNVHSTTILKEREGNTHIDGKAASIRARQLDCLVDAYRQCRDVHREACWVIGGDFNASPRELESNENIREYFTNAFLGPSRPNGSQVDTILLESRHGSGIAANRASRTKILVTQAYAASLHQSSAPQGEQNSAFETGWNDCIQQLLNQRVDHFPLLLEL